MTKQLINRQPKIYITVMILGLESDEITNRLVVVNSVMALNDSLTESDLL